MKIPSRFRLLGSTITVKVEPFEFEDSNNDACTGWAKYRTNEILLRPATNAEVLEAAFWHELTHFIMYHAGGSLDREEKWVNKCEDFVDLVGHLIMQAVNSFEYDEV